MTPYLGRMNPFAHFSTKYPLGGYSSRNPYTPVEYFGKSLPQMENVFYVD